MPECQHFRDDHPGGRSGMHQQPDERAGFRRAQPKAQQRGQQIQQLKVHEDLVNAHSDRFPAKLSALP